MYDLLLNKVTKRKRKRLSDVKKEKDFIELCHSKKLFTTTYL